MNRRLIWILFILLLSPLAFAEEQGVDIFIEILTYEYLDAYVVGDSFYYKINLTNQMSQNIEDKFSISVYNPRGELILPAKVYDKSIKSGESIQITAEGGKAGETAALPFDVSGDYEIILNTTKGFDLYRRFEIRTDRQISNKWVRSSGKLSYVFDVMPLWQYNLWKQEEKINKEMISLTKDLNIATKGMETATQNIEYATYAMLGVALLSLIVALVRR